MKAFPLISIVIPVYNAGPYVAEAVASAVNQSYANIEIICVDDCSNDNSSAVLRDLEREHEKVSVISLSVNRGASAARNVGINRARGEFILPLDADDYIERDYCKIAMDVFATNPSVSVVYARCRKFNDQSAWDWDLPEYSKEEMMGGNCVHVCGFFRKVDWTRFGGYDERLVALEDYDFWLYFTEEESIFYRIEDRLFCYRQHASHDSVTASFKKDRFRENTATLQVYLNHKDLFRDYFANIDLPEVDCYVKRILLNFLGLFVIVEKKRKYTCRYRKVYISILGLPFVGLARSGSKIEFFLLGLKVYKNSRAV